MVLLLWCCCGVMEERDGDSFSFVAMSFSNDVVSLTVFLFDVFVIYGWKSFMNRKITL